MRGLFYTVAALSLAACSKAPTPAPTQAPAPPAPGPSAGSAPAAPTPAAPPAQPQASSPVAEAPATAKPNGAITPQTEARPTPGPASADPFENDLRDLEIAVRLRDAFMVEEGCAQFDFKITMADGSNPVDETFTLEPTEGVVSARLRSEQRPGFYFCTYKLNAADRERMQAADTKFKSLRANSTGGNELTFQASVKTRLKTDVEAPDTFSLTIYARTHPALDFDQLAEEQVMNRDDPRAAALFSV